MRHSIRSNTTDPSGHLPSTRNPAHDPRLDGSNKQLERAVLACVLLPNSKTDFRNPFGELKALAASAGVEVVGSVLQKRTAISSATVLGKGRLQELTELAEATESDAVIFDNELRPRQVRALERIIGLKVIDRSELILDIFASRARTREAQMQVELALLQYTAPRLRGLWTHLERLAGAGGGTAVGSVGGVGTRGPGERQIEIDRRLVKKRISHLKREIDEIDRRKKREVTSRADQFTISLVGYTNSGKSTLMNRLTGSDCYIADRLFATLDTRTARWAIADGRSVLLSDTVGFIRDLPHHLVASFRATLEEAIHADLLLHVVDASAPDAYQQVEAVDSVLKDLGCEQTPQITVLNKIDISDDASLVELLARHRDRSIEISATEGTGLEQLRDEVIEQMQLDTTKVTLLVPHHAGKAVVELAQIGDMLDKQYDNEGVILTLHIGRATLAQLVGRYPAIVIRQQQDMPSSTDGPRHADGTNPHGRS